MITMIDEENDEVAVADAGQQRRYPLASPHS